MLKLAKFPDEDITDEKLAKEFFPVIGHKSHPTKIMVFAIVSKPIPRKNWTKPWRSAQDPGDQWLSDGKVFIAWCTAPVQRQRGRKLRDDDRPSMELFLRVVTTLDE